MNCKYCKSQMNNVLRIYSKTECEKFLRCPKCKSILNREEYIGREAQYQMWLVFSEERENKVEILGYKILCKRL